MAYKDRLPILLVFYLLLWSILIDIVDSLNVCKYLQKYHIYPYTKTNYKVGNIRNPKSQGKNV